MNVPQVYQRKATREEIGPLVDRFAGRDLRFLYYETVDGINLVEYHTPVPTYLHGRAFGETLEIRWTWNGEDFDVVLLTESEMGDLPGWTAWQAGCAGSAMPSPEKSTGEITVRLWGTHRKDLKSYHRLYRTEGGPSEWIETRLPRALVYPNAGEKKHAHARGTVYRMNGIPALLRWKRVEGSSE